MFFTYIITFLATASVVLFSSFAAGSTPSATLEATQQQAIKRNPYSILTDPFCDPLSDDRRIPVLGLFNKTDVHEIVDSNSKDGQALLFSPDPKQVSEIITRNLKKFLSLDENAPKNDFIAAAKLYISIKEANFKEQEKKSPDSVDEVYISQFWTCLNLLRCCAEELKTAENKDEDKDKQSLDIQSINELFESPESAASLRRVACKNGNRLEMHKNGIFPADGSNVTLCPPYAYMLMLDNGQESTFREICINANSQLQDLIAKYNTNPSEDLKNQIHQKKRIIDSIPAFFMGPQNPLKQKWLLNCLKRERANLIWTMGGDINLQKARNNLPQLNLFELVANQIGVMNQFPDIADLKKQAKQVYSNNIASELQKELAKEKDLPHLICELSKLTVSWDETDLDELQEGANPDLHANISMVFDSIEQNIKNTTVPVVANKLAEEFSKAICCPSIVNLYPTYTTDQFGFATIAMKKLAPNQLFNPNLAIDLRKRGVSIQMELYKKAIEAALRSDSCELRENLVDLIISSANSYQVDFIKTNVEKYERAIAENKADREKSTDDEKSKKLDDALPNLELNEQYWKGISELEPNILKLIRLDKRWIEFSTEQDGKKVDEFIPRQPLIDAFKQDDNSTDAQLIEKFDEWKKEQNKKARVIQTATKGLQELLKTAAAGEGATERATAAKDIPGESTEEKTLTEPKITLIPRSETLDPKYEKVLPIINAIKSMTNNDPNFDYDNGFGSGDFWKYWTQWEPSNDRTFTTRDKFQEEWLKEPDFSKDDSLGGFTWYAAYILKFAYYPFLYCVDSVVDSTKRLGHIISYPPKCFGLWWQCGRSFDLTGA